MYGPERSTTIEMKTTTAAVIAILKASSSQNDRSGGMCNNYLGRERSPAARGEVGLRYSPPAHVRSAWWEWEDFVSSPPTPAHFTVVKFADPPHRKRGRGKSCGNFHRSSATREE